MERLLIPAILIILSACACTRKIYVPVERETVRTDSVYAGRLRVDSVMLRDSVAVIQLGDTVYVTKYRDRYRYRERTDTVYMAATDTVLVSEAHTMNDKSTTGRYSFSGFAFLFASLCLAAGVGVAVARIKGGRKI